MTTGDLLTSALAQAVDFELTDTKGQSVRLSDYAGRRNVVLVFNRGFF